MTFPVNEHVRILTDPILDGDPPKGTVATVIGHFKDVNTVRCADGTEAGYFDFELEPAQ